MEWTAETPRREEEWVLEENSVLPMVRTTPLRATSCLGVFAVQLLFPRRDVRREGWARLGAPRVVQAFEEGAGNDKGCDEGPE